MDLNKENKKFLLDPNYNNIYIQNIKEILTKNNNIRRINKNQDNIIKKEEKKNSIGRKKRMIIQKVIIINIFQII